MWRVAFIAVVAAAGCKKSAPATHQEGDVTGAPPPERISVPGAEGTVDNKAMIGAAQELKPVEGTLVVGGMDTAAGTTATATVKIVPSAGYHVSTLYPTKLELSAPPGVHLEKATFAAGHEKKGDADTFSARGLSFIVKASADGAGTYAITGTFSFGVCTDENCHPKTQPITIAMAVK
ncbi:MAG TPA: hypothetical protein VLB44_12715 [Kofleriaceae bacterium]|nr:hypothetical protein [Kofleriaceae bacterium]